VPLRVSCGELPRTLVIVIALAAHLFLGEALCPGSPPLVGRKTPFADSRADSGEDARHVPSLRRNSRQDLPTLRLQQHGGKE
jgi:hypothetical protein